MGRGDYLVGEVNEQYSKMTNGEFAQRDARE